MKLTKEQLQHIASLVKISFSSSEEDYYIEKLSSILDYVSQLQKVDTENIKPTSQVTNLENVFRKDIVGSSLSQSDVLRNSKHTYKGYFKIPKIIE